MDAEMDEHGFNNVFDSYGTDNNESVDDSVGNALCKVNNRNMPFKNGYTSTQPIYTECTRMITDEGSMSIANACLVDMREKLYKYQSQNQKEKNQLDPKRKLRMKLYHYLPTIPPRGTKDLFQSIHLPVYYDGVNVNNSYVIKYY